MFKKITAIFILLLIFIPNGNTLEIEKVAPSLQYLYNYYFDPDAFNNDSSSIKDIKIIDLFKLNINPDTIPNNSVPVVGPSSNKIGVYIINRFPYIRADIAYTGDKNDLKALSVATGTSYNGYITARFPLSILLQIVSLPTVKYIYDSAIIQEEFIDPRQEPRIFNWIDNPVLIASVYEKSAEKRQLCFQITTARLFSTTGYKVGCNNEIIGNNIYVYVGTSSPAHNQVVGTAFSGASGECCLDFIDSVFYVHFISGDTSSFKVEVGKNLLSINVIKQGNLRLVNIDNSPFRRRDNYMPKKP